MKESPPIFIKLFTTLLLTLTACATLNTPSITLQPPSSQFEREDYQYVYDTFDFSSNYTEIPEDTRAFDATCYILDSDKSLVGTGVLIKSDVILTAAHVAVAVYNDHGYIQFDKDGDYIPMSEVWVHPVWLLYDGGTSDIGLVKLGCYVGGRAPIALSETGTHLKRYKSNIFTIGCSLGYKKQSLPKKIFYYGTLISDPSELKFRSNVTSIWFGDSGGPAILKQADGSLSVVGIMTEFTLFQYKLMDFTAADVRYHRPELEEIMDIWEENSLK